MSHLAQEMCRRWRASVRGRILDHVMYNPGPCLEECSSDLLLLLDLD